MIEKNLKTIKEYCSGSLDKKYDDIIIQGVSKDTRTLEKGNLYIPIIGENFDGHDFIEKAIDNGASASLWQKDHKLPDYNLPFIIVDNVLEAFQKLAENYRKSLDVKVIGITGSNGKTTTKDMLVSILSQKFRTKATKGNQNNEIGLPLTLLDLDEDTEICVCEMGTERFGEIKVLTGLAHPLVTAITNIGDSHLEELLTKENVAREKLDIVKGLEGNGIFVYNGQDPVLTTVMKEKSDILPNKILSFGEEKNLTHVVDNISSDGKATTFTINGIIYNMPTLGIHQVYNAACAIAISEIFGITSSEAERGLQNVNFTKMRNEVKTFKDFTILDDSYKSNPQNLRSAMNVLSQMSGYDHKILVLADMLALGKDEAKLHEEIADDIERLDVDGVYLFGELTKNIFKSLKKEGLYKAHFDDKKTLFEDLKKHLKANTLILVKGSRAMHMEEVVTSLEKLGGK